jgi:Flp pilus assembly protein TadG
MIINRRSTRSGGAVVEFALIASLTFLLIFGMISVGLGVWCYNNLADAVREGGRQASVHGSQAVTPWGSTANDANVTSWVKGFCFVMDPNHLTVTSSWPQGNNTAGSTVTVSGTYNFAWFFGTPQFGTIPLFSQTTMTIMH